MGELLVVVPAARKTQIFKNTTQKRKQDAAASAASNKGEHCHKV